MKTVERTQATATRHGGFEVATSVAVQPLQLWKVARFTPSSVLFLQERERLGIQTHGPAPYFRARHPISEPLVCGVAVLISLPSTSTALLKSHQCCMCPLRSRAKTRGRNIRRRKQNRQVGPAPLFDILRYRFANREMSSLIFQCPYHKVDDGMVLLKRTPHSASVGCVVRLRMCLPIDDPFGSSLEWCFCVWCTCFLTSARAPTFQVSCQCHRQPPQAGRVSLITDTENVAWTDFETILNNIAYLLRLLVTG